MLLNGRSKDNRLWRLFLQVCTIFNVISKIISGIVLAKNKTLIRNRSLSKKCTPKIQEY